MAGRTFGIADMMPTVEGALVPVLGDKAHEAAEAVLSVYIDPDPLAWDQATDWGRGGRLPRLVVVDGQSRNSRPPTVHLAASPARPASW